MASISFSKNWNNKLQCDNFSTVRPYSTKYAVGEVYAVYLDKAYLGKVRCFGLYATTFDEIKADQLLCALDAGLAPEDMANMLMNMYGDRAVTQQYAIVLLKWVEKLPKPQVYD